MDPLAAGRERAGDRPPRGGRGAPGRATSPWRSRACPRRSRPPTARCAGTASGTGSAIQVAASAGHRDAAVRARGSPPASARAAFATRLRPGRPDQQQRPVAAARGARAGRTSTAPGSASAGPRRRAASGVSAGVDRRRTDEPGRAWAMRPDGLVAAAQPGSAQASSRSDLGQRASRAGRRPSGCPAAPRSPRTSWRRSGPAAEAGNGGISSVPAGASSVPPANSCSIRPTPMLRRPGPARRHPAADRGQLPRLGLVADGQADGAEVRGERRARSSRRRR